MVANFRFIEPRKISSPQKFISSSSRYKHNFNSSQSLGGILKKTIKLVAVFATASLAFGFAPVATAATATKACLALDTGGVDDKSFNASAWAGAQAAVKKNSSVTAPMPLGAASSADYAPNIKKLVDADCDIIVGVGFAINDAIVAAAKANPTVKFAIVDQDGKSDGKPLANLKPLEFATNESSFQAGYLAAGVSKTGKVATYGGLPFPSVTIFMDGFAKGVAHYNKIKGKDVQVLGWDIKTQEGTMVGGFGDSAKALQISKNFEQQGADVILPVAGGLAGATAANSIASKKSYVIWVDTDGFVSANSYRKVLLTSVMKRVDLSVQNVILDVANNKFSSKGYMGTFANQGTKLAPYHDLIRVVPSALRN
jgi:basic membrane protein A and related proteins